MLLVPLETLAGVEESTVRDKAVEAISTISRAMNSENVLKHVVPLVRRLANGDWFTSRISAAGLFAVTYPRADDSVKKLLRRSASFAPPTPWHHNLPSYALVVFLLLAVCTLRCVRTKLRWSEGRRVLSLRYSIALTRSSPASA